MWIGSNKIAWNSKILPGLLLVVVFGLGWYLKGVSDLGNLATVKDESRESQEISFLGGKTRSSQSPHDQSPERLYLVLPKQLTSRGIAIDTQYASSSRSIFLDIAIPNNYGPLTAIKIIIYPNEKLLSLENWFAENIDTPNKALLKAHTFCPSTTNQERKILFLCGEVPVEYADAGGVYVPIAIVMSQKSNAVAVLDLSQDDDLPELGYDSGSKQGDLIKEIANTLDF